MKKLSLSSILGAVAIIAPMQVFSQTSVTLDGTSGTNTTAATHSTSGGLTIGLGFFVDYLIVGGGGGNGGGVTNVAYPSGGGGGGVISGSAHQVGTMNYNLTVGAGGTAGGNGDGGDGGSSSLFGQTAGGGLGPKTTNPGVGGTSASGFLGGDRASGPANGAQGGGGGGNAGAGTDGIYIASPLTRIGGTGGVGTNSTITGTSLMYGFGGGGGAPGGNFQNGDGTTNVNARANSGGGGAGAGTGGGPGAAGTVVVRYQGSAAATGGTITAGTGSAIGYTIHSFTSTGSSSFNMSSVNLNQRLGTTASGLISGIGTMEFVGPGRLILTADNTYVGDTTITAGTLQVGNGGVTGGLGTGNVINHSALVVNRSGSIEIAGNISGNGTLLKEGSGTLTLSGTNNFSGGTTVTGGVLTGSSASLVGAIVNSATVEFNQSSTGTYAGSMSGNGSLRKVGSGVVAFSGNSSSFSGNTTISAGELKVNGSLASSAVTVENGGILGGSGTVGATTVESGGTISPGNSPGTLQIAEDLNWFANGNYNWQIHNATSTAGSGWDLIDVAGQLNLSALSSSNRFNINLWSLSSIGPDVNGAAVNFNPYQNYTWTIVTTTGGIVGFSGTDQFTINTAAINGTAGFANAVPSGGVFTIEQSGDNLNLVYTIPEPSSFALLAVGAGLLALRRRAMKKAGRIS